MTQKNKHIIFENENYSVEVGDSTQVQGQTTYHVVNKFTGVTEREDSVWPSAVQAAKFFNDEILEFEKEGAAQETASVIPLSTH